MTEAKDTTKEAPAEDVAEEVLETEVAEGLKLEKKALMAKLNKVKEQLGEKKVRSFKYALPTKPRTGKYATVLTNRDRRVVWENKLLRKDEDLFIQYLLLQKKNSSLNDWTDKYHLTDEQIKSVKNNK